MFGNRQQTPAQQARNQAFEIRKTTYQHTWKTDLKGAILKDPGFCCLAVLCAPCVSYYVRKRAIYDDMTRYVCCNGDCPCSGMLSEQSCPELCLCLEVFFCFSQSVASTRWLLQDEMHIQNTECDNCLIGTMIAFQYLACICDIAACISGSEEIYALSQIVDLIANFLYCSVCACMQTQHKVQIDERAANSGIVRPPLQNPYGAPPPQVINPGVFVPGQQPQPAGPGMYAPQGYPQQGPPPGYPQQGQYPPGYAQGPPPGYPQGAPVQGYPQQGPYPPQGAPPGYPGGMQR